MEVMSTTLCIILVDSKIKTILIQIVCNLLGSLYYNRRNTRYIYLKERVNFILINVDLLTISILLMFNRYSVFKSK